jgi:hypothetical protein
MQASQAAASSNNGTHVRGRVAFYHPNGKGTGSALQVELRLSRNGEDRHNCMFFEMARQKTAAMKTEDGRKPATFDWETKVTVKLEFTDICELLTVLEGKADHAGGAHDGIYHEAGNANAIIAFKRNAEPPGYLLGISKRTKAGEQVFRGQLVLSEAEAIGLRCLLQSSLFPMTLGSALAAGGGAAAPGATVAGPSHPQT